MEAYKITFYREREEDNASETIEVMAENEEILTNVFHSAEPFAIILKIEKI